MNRTSGILLHLTSLPGPFGIGDVGPAARRFVDFLATAGQGLWQVLPLGPTGYADSPYQALSAFAGNPLLISPEILCEEGWLDAADLSAPEFPTERVDYGAVLTWKQSLLQRAQQRFEARAGADQRADLHSFRQQHTDWLADYALFIALKHHHHGVAWTQWDPALSAREAPTLKSSRRQLADAIDFHVFCQYQFFHQWQALRRYAHSKGVRLIGDVPLFVAHDSADVWAHPEWFFLGAAGQPTVVAGVPPDYFSAEGQLWGNPLYRWEALAAEDYGFWVERLRLLLSLVDQVRIDHFRGLASYWEIPANHPTAIDGHWVEGPGMALLDTLSARLGHLPLIAEDLGLVTPDVEALRKQCGAPGMAILQFAFDVDFDGFGHANFLPHNHIRDRVVYTGTHDNDTTVGWWRSRSDKEQDFVRRYLNISGDDIHWDLIRTALASVADTAIIPLQDILGLGDEARMNRPGRTDGNWVWRYRENDLTSAMAERLHDLSTLYSRQPL